MSGPDPRTKTASAAHGGGDAASGSDSEVGGAESTASAAVFRASALAENSRSLMSEIERNLTGASAAERSRLRTLCKRGIDLSRQLESTVRLRDGAETSDAGSVRSGTQRGLELRLRAAFEEVCGRGLRLVAGEVVAAVGDLAPARSEKP